MATPGNLTIEGSEQGAIEGSCETVGREGTIAVQSWDHIVEIPTDSRGVVSGRRVHRPMVIAKEIDKSSPMLYQALCTGEKLNSVKLDWYRLDGAGEEELYFSVLMGNALISRVRPWVPNVLDKSNAGFRHMEDVSIIYEKILWTWEPDGIEYEDAWGEDGV